MAGVRRLRSEADLLGKEGVNLNGTEKVNKKLYNLGKIALSTYFMFSYFLGEGIGSPLLQTIDCLQAHVGSFEKDFDERKACNISRN